MLNAESVSGERTGPDDLQDPPTDGTGNPAPSAGEPVVVGDDGSDSVAPARESSGTATDPGATPDTMGTPGSDSREVVTSVFQPDVPGTEPGSVRQALLPRHNPAAGDLLDHWGHRQRHGITQGLSLPERAGGGDAADLRRLQAAAQTAGEAPVAPDLHDDEVRILGAHRGVTYGRWTGGPADTLSIEFDLSRAGLPMHDAAFRAMLERAGKAWSHRVADTWTTWVRPEGAHKGWFINGGDHIEVRVGAGGEISTGLEIDIVDADLPETSAGWANSGAQRPGGSWEPRFGSIEIDTAHLREAGESRLYSTLVHEIGHLLGAWQGGSETEDYAPYTDTESGTWTGPHVVALHGGPAPFQDDGDPHGWVDGQRDPFAPSFDFAHSGVCASIMAYCNSEAALPPHSPHAVDFAFLADLGVTVIQETGRPETYGLAGWTDYAGFTLSVSRDLRVTRADPQPYYDRLEREWQGLEVTDLLQVGVDAFGYRTTGDIGITVAGANPLGSVRYTGGLIGAAINRDGMPPVTGDASLSVDLGTLDGAASFTSLALHAGGSAETFAGGVLHYPLAVSGNALVGTQVESTLLADFYGPEREDVAGTLHDPRAGLLASFGATADARPEREDVIASADYLAGLSFRRGASDEVDNGWFQYRCASWSYCETRDDEAGFWTDWTAATRESVLASTAGWDARDTARPADDRDFVRVVRQSAATTDGARGRHVVDGYTATLEHGAFGTGFERYSDEWDDPVGTPGGLYRWWTGAQGASAGVRPDARAQWSGLMLGYDRGHGAGEHPFVEGVATIDYHLSANRMDVAFSQVTSRDGRRAIPDISFRAIEPRADGTFAGGGRTGILNGAFLGPSGEEVAGVFNHRATDVAGSFGARAVPDTVTLEDTGTVDSVFTTTDDSGAGVPFFWYDDWGLWARQFQEDVFGVFVEQTVSSEDGRNLYWAPTTRISGTPTGSNPVSGGAVWTGAVRAFDTAHAGNLPVSGSARLEVDFHRATVDVEFSDLDGGRADMAWQGLRLSGGTFRDMQTDATIEGAFYGTDHRGAAGEFDRDSLRGVFGAVRN